MMGPIFALMNAVFLAVLVICLVRNTEPGKGFWSKTYHMLLLMAMRADITLAYGNKYIRNTFAHIFSRSSYGPIREDGISRKEQRLKELRRQISRESQGYKRKERYSRKILD